MPAEYFNPHLNPGWERFAPHHSLFQRILRRLRRQRQPLRPDRTWLKRLVLERSARSLLTGQPFFAAKLQPQQLGPLPAALQCSFAPLAESLLWAPFQLVPPALVLLYRQDWLAALLSHHLALCTGSFDQGRVFSFQLRPITNLGSREALLSDLASYRSHIESLVETLECTPYPIHCLTFEHLLRDQPATLARLIRAIEPPDQPLAQLEQHPSLAVQIQRAPNPWSADHRAWKRHLHQRFLEEGLDRHPNALACAAAIAALNHFSNP